MDVNVIARQRAAEHARDAQRVGQENGRLAQCTGHLRALYLRQAGGSRVATVTRSGDRDWWLRQHAGRMRALKALPVLDLP